MVKITGYKTFISTGGNKCIQCNTRMAKGLPYIAPVSGKRVVKELTGKSICISCIEELSKRVDSNLDKSNEKQLERYETRRFLENLT